MFDDDGNLWYTAPGNKIAPEPEERNILFTVSFLFFFTSKIALARGRDIEKVAEKGACFPGNSRVITSSKLYCFRKHF